MLVQLVGRDAELLGDLGVGGVAMQAVLQGDVGLLDLAGLEPNPTHRAGAVGGQAPSSAQARGCACS
jgi:hypothetical protein